MAENLQVVPTSGDTFGGWIGNGNSDYHIYVNEYSVVVGHNPTYKDLKFSSPAVSFNKDGTVTLQYAKDGQPKWVEIPVGVAKELIQDFLERALIKSLPIEVVL